MEPWEDEAEKAEFRRVLEPRGANADQAETARLVGWLYKDDQIAGIRGVSVSKVKLDLRILFAILDIKDRDRHVLGRVARRLVEAERPGRALPSPKAAVPLPEPKPGERGRHSGRGGPTGRPRDSDGEPRAGR
jgi:hypothetical protein